MCEQQASSPFFFTMVIHSSTSPGQSGHDIVVKAIVDNEQSCPALVIVKPVCSRTRLFKMAIVAVSPWPG
jgi:hypothetical protein